MKLTQSDANTLSSVELQRLQAILNNPSLLQANKEYGLMAVVIDSWMEWDIRVPRDTGALKIKVLNFAPASARESNQAYPASV